MGEYILPELEPYEVQEVVEAYKEIFLPTVKITNAFIRRNDEFNKKIITFEAVQQCLERGSTCTIQRTIICDEFFKSCLNVNTVDSTAWVFSAMSKSEILKAVMYTSNSVDEKGKKTNYFLEIWSEEKIIITFDLNNLDLHGPVYTDDTFGSFNWSHEEDKIVYVAEKKKPKTAPFYDQKPKKEVFDNENEPLVGLKHLYEDDWGEQLSPKTNPVIVVCDTSKKVIEILAGIPENISPGQIIWDPSDEGVVGTGYTNKHRRLGLVFCINRPSCIFHLSLKGKYTVLSDPTMSVCSPQFSPDGKYLVWLQCPVGGPHFSASALIKCNWNTKEVTTVVNIVNDVVLTKNGKEFFGIYCTRLRTRCWTSDSKYVLLSSFQKQRINSYAINIDNGNITDISSADENESTIFLDVSSDNFAVYCISSLTHPHRLASVFIPSITENPSNEYKWNYLTTSVPFNDSIISQFVVVDTKTKKKRCYAMYYGPKKEQTQSVPVILFPHGGPHANTPSVFSPLLCFFTHLGFGVLIVNYQGSVGYGNDYVHSLPGNVGKLDVDDCYSALQNSLENFPWLDPNNVHLYGGSHGGFLVTYLSSKFPNDFKSVVARNPVTNFPALLYTSDIPDWCVVEAGSDYQGITNVMCNAELWKKMCEISPIYMVNKVLAPTLLLLGTKDKRVPSSQGLSYYNALKELEIPTRIFIYDDNHSLSNVAVEMDSQINAVLWFKRSMKYER